MSFSSLFSGPPNKGIPVADSASNQRETTGAVKTELNSHGNTNVKKKKKRTKKKKQENQGGNGWMEVHSGNGQQNTLGERPQIPSHGGELDKEHRPQGKVDWTWDYGQTEEYVSNRRKRRKKCHDPSYQNKGDFANAEDRDQRVGDATPPTPPFPFPFPRPGTGPGQMGRGRGGMNRGRGFRNGRPRGRHFGNGRPYGRDFGNERPNRGDFGNDGPNRGDFGNDGPNRGDFGNDGPNRGDFGNDGPNRGDFGNDRLNRGDFGNDRPCGRGFGNGRPNRGDFGNDGPNRGDFGNDGPNRGDFGNDGPCGRGFGNGRPNRGDFRNDRPNRGDFGNDRPNRGDFGNDRPNGRGFRNNRPYGRDRGNGRGRRRRMGEPEPEKEKKVYLSEDYINKHSMTIQGRRICKHFMRGDCVKAEQCNFEHATDVKIMEVCKFHVMGSCTREVCLYMHEEFPCKFFHTGARCFQGDACRYSHEPLTDVTRELLEKVLNHDPAKSEEPDQTVQDDDSSFPLTSSPPPPVSKLTVDMADNVVIVRPNFYNSSLLTECQPMESSTPPQSLGSSEVPHIKMERKVEAVPHIKMERRVEAVPHIKMEREVEAVPHIKMEREVEAVPHIKMEREVEAVPHIKMERKVEAVPHIKMERMVEAVPHIKMERKVEAVWDDLPSSPVEEGPKPVTSILKTLFLHLVPTHEEPQISARETGVSVTEQPGTPLAMKTEAAVTVTVKQKDEAQSFQHRAKPAPFHTSPCAQDAEREAEEAEGLKDEPVWVPLDALPGAAQRDPRPARRTAAVTLPLPPFAHAVEPDAEKPVPLHPQVGISSPNCSPAPHCPPPLAGTPEPPSSRGTSSRSVGPPTPRFPLADTPDPPSCTGTSPWSGCPTPRFPSVDTPESPSCTGTSPWSGSPTPHFPRNTPESPSCGLPSPRNLPPVAVSAVHKLPVPVLIGRIYPSYSKGKAVKREGERPPARETPTKGNVLKGLFTTLLPASD